VKGSNSSTVWVIWESVYGPTYITLMGSTYLNLYMSQQYVNSLSRRFHDSMNKVAQSVINNAYIGINSLLFIKYEYILTHNFSLLLHRNLKQNQLLMEKLAIQPIKP
jgi:hypothetical protein